MKPQPGLEGSRLQRHPTSTRADGYAYPDTGGPFMLVPARLTEDRPTSGTRVHRSAKQLAASAVAISRNRQSMLRIQDRVFSKIMSEERRYIQTAAESRCCRVRASPSATVHIKTCVSYFRTADRWGDLRHSQESTTASPLCPSIQHEPGGVLCFENGLARACQSCVRMYHTERNVFAGGSNGTWNTGSLTNHNN